MVSLEITIFGNSHVMAIMPNGGYHAVCAGSMLIGSYRFVDSFEPTQTAWLAIACPVIMVMCIICMG